MRPPQKNQLTPDNAFRLPDVLAEYLVACRARALSPKTISLYRDELTAFVAWLAGRDVHRLTAIAAEHLRGYLIHLAEAHGRNAGGQHVAYRTVRAFLRWAEREYQPAGWRDPTRTVKAPRLPFSPLPPADADHVRAILATCRPRTLIGDRDRAILLALVDSGLRANELLQLNREDFEPDSGALIVRRGKGAKRRVAFVGATTAQAILRYLRHRGPLRPDDPLFSTRSGKRLRYNGLREMLRRRARRAGLAKAPPVHSFRRLFTLMALRGGMDLETLRRLLGHATLELIKRYAALESADLAAAHRAHSPVDRFLR